MEDGHGRFKSLIEPIKDLAANWDIDVAESLSDYLEELESLRITLDGGETQLNFAEAALLIQGSTTIYSRKVEYLHQLVLKSLEFITSKKVKKDKIKSNNNDNNDGNKTNIDDDLLEFGCDPSFLLLDNVVEPGHNIDLRSSVNDLNSKRLSGDVVS
jgi:condensin-2 complex subunit H2